MFGQKSPKIPNSGLTRIFSTKRGTPQFWNYFTLTSCKKLEKSNEWILRYWAISQNVMTLLPTPVMKTRLYRLTKLEITNIQIAIYEIIGCISLLKCQKVDKSFPNFCPFFKLLILLLWIISSNMSKILALTMWYFQKNCTTYFNKNTIKVVSYYKLLLYPFGFLSFSF